MNLIDLFKWGVLCAVLLISFTVSYAQSPDLIVERVHTQLVNSVVFSPNGELLASYSYDRTVKIWDAKRFREIKTFPLPCGSIAFTKDSRGILCTLDYSIGIVDLATGQKNELKLKVDPWQMQLVENSNTLIVLCRDGIVRQIDLKTGEELFGFESPGRDPKHTSSFVLSRDGRFLIVVDAASQSTLWDVRKRQRLNVIKEEVKDGDFSNDNNLLASPAYQDVAIWRRGQEEISKFIKVQRRYGTRALFSPTQPILAVNQEGGILRLWNTRTWEALPGFNVNVNEKVKRTVWDRMGVRPYPGFGEISSMAFSPDGRYVVCGTAPRRSPGPSPLKIFDLRNRVSFETTSTRPPQVYSASFDARGSLLASAVGDEVKIWNLTSGRLEQTLEGHDEINAVVFSPTDDVITSASDAYRTVRGRIIRWDSKSGEEIGSEDTSPLQEEVGPSFTGTSSHVNSLAYSYDGKLLASGGRAFRGGQEHQVVLWNAQDGRVEHLLGTHQSAVSAVSFTRDNEILVSGNTDEDAEENDFHSEVMIWRVKDATLIKKLEGASAPLAIDPDDRVLATRNPSGGVQLWNLRDQRPLQVLPSDGTIKTVAYSPDGRFLLGGQSDGAIVVWDTKDNYRAQRFNRHIGSVRSIAFRASDNLVATAGDDATIHLWRLSGAGSLTPLCSLFSFENNAWAVVTPDGRFDTNDVEEARGLHWIFPDEPFRTLPAEIFMRDYYEPRLLQRLLEGKDFTKLRSLASLNRVQPEVQIEKISPVRGRPNTISVRVKVAGVKGKQLRRGKIRTLESGAVDLRLFRDGQLVGYKEGNLLTGNSGFTSVPFTVRLAQNADQEKVSLSAYAFNQDRVKSATVTQTFILPPNRRTVKGRAYVISVGVNAYEDKTWDLSFAGADARASQEILARNLGATEDFDEVVCISLISERGESGVVSSERLATKKNFKSILEVLAGHLSPASVSAQLSGANRLRKANPEDLVLITFSSHGYTDKQGTFYLIPYDTGTEVRFGARGEIRPESRAKFISSDELSMWLKDIDAGEIALVVDTCHSAAAVEAGGFKPGPMGSRGMGQLAYDKGIRILAASQADDVAVEINRLRHGLLTYALMLDGLEKDKANLDEDDTINLDEWLAYGAQRVPLLYEKLKHGDLKELTERDLRITSLVIGPSVKKNGFQRPSLFNFRRTKREVQIKKLQSVKKRRRVR